MTTKKQPSQEVTHKSTLHVFSTCACAHLELGEDVEGPGVEAQVRVGDDEPVPVLAADAVRQVAHVLLGQGHQQLLAFGRGVGSPVRLQRLELKPHLCI